VDVALFYSGLVAFTALMVFGALAVMAVVPMIIPGYTSASITSGSMMPTLRVGDVVIAVDHNDTKIAPDTVVVYEEPRRHDLVTHRVVSVNPDGSYITKGDANGVNDPAPIPAANIRGKTQWIVPFVGLPRVWATQHRWTLLILTIAVTAMTLWLARFAFDPRHDPWPKPAQPDVEVDGTEIAPETIVVYEEPRRHDLVTHRVVSTNPDGSYVTKGEGNGVNDPAPIPVANIRGRTQWIVPFVGLPRVWATQHRWTLLILTIAVTAMTLWLARFAFDPRHDPWPKPAQPDVEVRA
jgi:signal peptidase